MKHIVPDQSDMNLICFQGLFLIMVTCTDMHLIIVLDTFCLGPYSLSLSVTEVACWLRVQ